MGWTAKWTLNSNIESHFLKGYEKGFVNNKNNICSKINVGYGFKENCHCNDLIEFSGNTPIGKYLNGSLFDIKKPH